MSPGSGRGDRPAELGLFGKVPLPQGNKKTAGWSLPSRVAGRPMVSPRLGQVFGCPYHTTLPHGCQKGREECYVNFSFRILHV